MKTTGISRRVDRLGRIVVPKEIRTRFKISEGDQVEICVNSDEEIVLKKYSLLEGIRKTAEKCSMVLGRYTGHAVLITDRERIIASYGMREDVLGMCPEASFFERLNDRKPIRCSAGDDCLGLGAEENEIAQQYIVPVICESDIAGAIVLRTRSSAAVIKASDEAAAGYAAALLGMRTE